MTDTSVVIRLRLGKVKHGWLPVDLAVGATTFAFLASYMPYDFVAELVGALSGALVADGSYVARLNEEPAQSDWTFQRAQDVVAFSIVRYPDNTRRRGEGELIVDCRGSALDIIVPFWRGLQELAARNTKGGYDKAHWRADFPSAALQRLAQRIEQARQGE